MHSKWLIYLFSRGTTNLFLHLYESLSKKKNTSKKSHNHWSLVQAIRRNLQVIPRSSKVIPPFSAEVADKSSGSCHGTDRHPWPERSVDKAAVNSIIWWLSCARCWMFPNVTFTRTHRSLSWFNYANAIPPLVTPRGEIVRKHAESCRSMSWQDRTGWDTCGRNGNVCAACPSVSGNSLT